MNERPLRVLQMWQGDQPVSMLRLAGRWLERLGFEAGRRVRVQAAPGRLVVELDEDDPWWRMVQAAKARGEGDAAHP